MIVKAAIIFRGKTYVGWRHSFILEDIRQDLGVRKVHTRDQGFIADDGRYVGRAEAAEISVAAGQVPKKEIRGGHLFSEEMWSKDGVPREWKPEDFLSENELLGV